jgi:hypothetical protein
MRIFDFPFFKLKTKERLEYLENQLGDNNSCWHGSIIKRLNYLEKAIGSGSSIKSVLVDPKLPTPKEQIEQINKKIDAICEYLGIEIKDQLDLKAQKKKNK